MAIQATKSTYLALLAAGHFIPEVAEGTTDFCSTFNRGDTAALFRYAKIKTERSRVLFSIFSPKAHMKRIGTF